MKKLLQWFTGRTETPPTEKKRWVDTVILIGAGPDNQAVGTLNVLPLVFRQFEDRGMFHIPSLKEAGLDVFPEPCSACGAWPDSGLFPFSAIIQVKVNGRVTRTEHVTLHQLEGFAIQGENTLIVDRLLVTNNKRPEPRVFEFGRL